MYRARCGDLPATPCHTNPLPFSLSDSPFRVFRHRDFRLLWIGAFLSFTGSWVQSSAQGLLVYQLTGDEAKLAFVSFCGMAPVSILGPFAGTLADAFNKRTLMIFAQAALGLGAGFLAYATWRGFVGYGHIVAVALLFGIVGCFEMPTRQSIIGRVVPADELATAVPLNAMTFNVSRLIGPGVGTWLFAHFGAAICYLANMVSYLGLIGSAVGIKADLSPTAREPQPVLDLLLEGMRYTFRDQRLKTLFVMEATVSAFGLAYLSLMPAFARQMVEAQAGSRLATMDPKEITYQTAAMVGGAMTSVGIGALAGLMLTTWLSARPLKAKLIQGAMTLMGLALLVVSFARSPWFAFPCFAVMGGCAILQFNTTNSLFQLLSPERLRGRVISMHVWALSGLGPFGTLFFGWLARETKGDPRSPVQGIPLIMLLGGGMVLLGSLWGYRKRTALEGV